LLLDYGDFGMVCEVFFRFGLLRKRNLHMKANSATPAIIGLFALLLLITSPARAFDL
jgi:hypothetical protein